MNFKLTIKHIAISLGVHLAMCILPLLFVTLLNGDPKFTVNAPYTAGQIIIYAVYALFVAIVYFILGRKTNIPSNVISSVIIAAIGLAVYFGVVAAERTDISFTVFFAMPQFMVLRVFAKGSIGNRVLSGIVMCIPSILLWMGKLSTGVKTGRKKK